MYIVVGEVSRLKLSLVFILTRRYRLKKKTKISIWIFLLVSDILFHAVLPCQQRHQKHIWRPLDWRPSRPKWRGPSCGPNLAWEVEASRQSRCGNKTKLDNVFTIFICLLYIYIYIFVCAYRLYKDCIQVVCRCIFFMAALLENSLDGAVTFPKGKRSHGPRTSQAC